MSDNKEIKNAATRTLFSLVQIPIIGQALNELIDFRGKIKQNRLNQFTELLENYFSNHKGINLESFQTEKFSDLFESVVKRVFLTKSKEKMRMFRDILINHLNDSLHNIDDSEIYLDLISNLSEIEIKILSDYRQFVKLYQSEVNALSVLENKLSAIENKTDTTKPVYQSDIIDIQTQIGRRRKELNRLQSIYTHDTYGITKDQFLFYKQRLFSKGLLVDNGIGSIGGKPFNTMGITQFGIQFIDYIMVS